MTALLDMGSLLNQAFAEAVCRTMDNWRGQRLSLRQARMRTGVDIDTLSRMRHGEVPRMDKVVAFARGFELDPNDWLELAGYERLDKPRESSTPPPGESDQERLREHVAGMVERLRAQGVELDPQVGTYYGGASSLTVDEIIHTLEAVERRILETEGRKGGA